MANVRYTGLGTVPAAGAVAQVGMGQIPQGELLELLIAQAQAAANQGGGTRYAPTPTRTSSQTTGLPLQNPYGMTAQDSLPSWRTGEGYTAMKTYKKQGNRYKRVNSNPTVSSPSAYSMEGQIGYNIPKGGQALAQTEGKAVIPGELSRETGIYYDPVRGTYTNVGSRLKPITDPTLKKRYETAKYISRYGQMPPVPPQIIDLPGGRAGVVHGGKFTELSPPPKPSTKTPYEQDKGKMIDDTISFYKSQSQHMRDAEGFIRPQYAEDYKQLAKKQRQDMVRIRKGQLPSWLNDELPDPSLYKDTTIENKSSGTQYRSDGTKWKIVK